MALLAIGLYATLFPGPAPLTERDIQQGIASALASQTPGPPLSQAAYDAVRPSLVLIETDQPEPSGRSGQGLGSGVVVDASGDILTALHVVDGATTIQVTFADGTKSEAEVVTRRPENDIAVIRAAELPAGVAPATLGDPRSVQIGSDAFVVGNPFGLYGSMSTGVVSGLERSFKVPGQRPRPPRPHPGGRRGQSGQLGWPPAEPGRPGHRHRDRPGQPIQGERLHRDRSRRADRRGRRRCRPAAVLRIEEVSAMDPEASAARTVPMERVLYEVKKVIVGQDHLLERMVVALLARGHLLVEGVPGLAKTMAIKTLAAAVGGEFKRIQFTPDLVPADLIGTRIYNQKTGDFSTSLGPVFTNLLLADEINRAPAKVQSALLEVMQEHQVTIGHESFKVPEPFLVLATQNPIETEGTYALPEAQVDRFMLKVIVGYPSPTEEYAIVERQTGPAEMVQRVLSTDDLLALQGEVDRVFVDPALVDYAVRLATATRAPAAHGMPELERYITYGASPRASINLILTAKALAYVRGRDYALPQDVRDMARDVMRHRLVLSFEALSDDIAADNVLTTLLNRIPAPVVPLREHDDVGVSA